MPHRHRDPGGQRRAGLLLCGGLAVAVSACTASGAAPAPSQRAASARPHAAPTFAPSRDAAGTVWLCRPGLRHDPCAGSLSATTVLASGLRVERPAPKAGGQGFDCFYVYPTASGEHRLNADLRVQAAETQVAFAQAARFSQVCSVWAPMYRQVTVSGLGAVGQRARHAGQVAFASVLAAWRDFLAHYDDGRPIIFIGHSQGSVMLIRLLSQYVDPDPALRRRMVAAILAGGNVVVPAGKLVGGSFRHLPLCAAARQAGCVIAYSSFPSRPPADSLFGRPGQGVSVMSGQTATAGLQVACVNPADIGGGAADLTPYFPVSALFPMTAQSPPGPALSTPWVSYPGLYRASCESSGGASWLQVTDSAGAGDHRPVVTEALGPAWGYHLEDVNLALGNLVADVQAEEQAYVAGGGPP